MLGMKCFFQTPSGNDRDRNKVHTNQHFLWFLVTEVTNPCISDAINGALKTTDGMHETLAFCALMLMVTILSQFTILFATTLSIRKDSSICCIISQHLCLILSQICSCGSTTWGYRRRRNSRGFVLLIQRGMLQTCSWMGSWAISTLHLFIWTLSIIRNSVEPTCWLNTNSQSLLEIMATCTTEAHIGKWLQGHTG